MSATRWDRGTVVRLKSGGPKMTVDSSPSKLNVEYEAYSVTCLWFDELELCEGRFDSESIEAAKEVG